MSQFQGILPAVVTPLDADERFNAPVFEQLLERLYATGVHGMYVCGQTGEGMQLRASERKAAAECAVRNSPRGKHVIVHVGATSTAEAVELARHAKACGAHAVSSLPPAGAYSFEEIRAYYGAVAAASDLPLLVYYFPSIAPALRTPEQMLELCRIENVVGLKYTDSDLYRMWRIKRDGPVIFNGSDEMLVAGLIMGADGGIGSTYNLMPAAFVALWEHARAGRWDEARALQNDINELIAVILRYPVLPAVKALLRSSGVDAGPCAKPRRELHAEEIASLVAEASGTKLGAPLVAGSQRVVS